MSDSKSSAGSIEWVDLTSVMADELKNFYGGVIGWKAMPVSMGDYEDYAMSSEEGGAPVAGICHARGMNAELPPQWLIYINVDDLNRSMAECRRLGGKILAGPKKLGEGDRYCVIQDPAGAVAALYCKKT